jgi:hypothetical protein
MSARWQHASGLMALDLRAGASNEAPNILIWIDFLLYQRHFCAVIPLDGHRKILQPLTDPALQVHAN